LKAGVRSGKPVRKKGQLKKMVIWHMRILQKKPTRVVKYFQQKMFQYAA